MTMTNTGNVGIGTTAPLYNQHIHSTAADATTLAISNPGTDVAQQTAIALYTKGGTGKLGTANQKGWQITARGDAYTTAAQQNDFMMWYWDGSAWISPLLMVQAATSASGRRGQMFH